MYENFEQNNIYGWIQDTTNSWASSTNSPITGLRSMQHNASDISSTSFFYTHLDAKTNVHSTWRFNIKNDWDAAPSHYNKFWVYLTASEGNLTNNTVCGYAIGVNFDGDNDLLKLWRVTDGQADKVLIESSFNWGANDTVGIEVSRSHNGIWNFRYNNQGGFSNMTFAGSSTDSSYTDLEYFGLYYRFSSTRSGKLWCDDISIIQNEPPSNTPPDILASPSTTTITAGINEPITILITAFETATDSNQTLSLTSTNLPPGATFPTTNGISPLTSYFTWTPTQAGKQGATFNAYDVDGTNSITVKFNITAPTPSRVWINEIHYDNASTDINEGVEVAGYANTSLHNYKLIFYNGIDGSIYDELTLSGTIDYEQDFFGAVWFDKSDIQNGPDGIALISITNNKTNLHQFISYEGSFTATEGPAINTESTNINTDESPAPNINNSLQLTGTGNIYNDFHWSAPAPHSRGYINEDQTITPPGTFIVIE